MRGSKAASTSVKTHACIRGACCQCSMKCHGELSLFCCIVSPETLLYISGVASRCCLFRDVSLFVSFPEATPFGNFPGTCFRRPEVLPNTVPDMAQLVSLH